MNEREPTLPPAVSKSAPDAIAAKDIPPAVREWHEGDFERMERGELILPSVQDSYQESTGGVEVYEYDLLSGEWVKSR
jgi:hypothetical protein